MTSSVIKLLNINIGFMGIPLGKGNFEIELSYSTPNLPLTAIISIAGILAYIILIVYIINKKLKSRRKHTSP